MSGKNYGHSDVIFGADVYVNSVGFKRILAVVSKVVKYCHDY
jgi:hypothetical protein